MSTRKPFEPTNPSANLATTAPASRRTFLQASAAGAVSLLIWEKKGIAAASDRLNIAAVGVGGKGQSDIELTSVGQNVVAICDVDARSLARAQQKYPDARPYRDWRKLLEQKDIDAVTVSTPDHMHAPVAVSAMQLGKHVYVQKPLAHTLFESRRMREIAARHGVVTQMGNQGHSSGGYKTLVQLIRGGAIGKVREAHAWSDRPIWPQGIGRPGGEDPVPDYLDWDLWLGVARQRPFVGQREASKRDRGAYHPFNWRGWFDFGVGALGDMGCHIIDPVFWSCELAPARQVWYDGPAANDETYPVASVVHYEFAGTKHTGADSFRLTWYDGGQKPALELAQLPAGEALPSNGSLFIGERGNMLCEHGEAPRLLPADKFAGKELTLSADDDHYQQWTNACKGTGQTTSHFDYAGPLTETVLLGTVAIRVPGQQLHWDSAALRFTNCDAANQFIHHPYRAGWQVAGLERA